MSHCKDLIRCWYIDTKCEPYHLNPPMTPMRALKSMHGHQTLGIFGSKMSSKYLVDKRRPQILQTLLSVGKWWSEAKLTVATCATAHNPLHKPFSPLCTNHSREQLSCKDLFANVAENELLSEKRPFCLSHFSSETLDQRHDGLGTKFE